MNKERHRKLEARKRRQESRTVSGTSVGFPQPKEMRDRPPVKVGGTKSGAIVPPKPTVPGQETRTATGER